MSDKKYTKQELLEFHKELIGLWNVSGHNYETFLDAELSKVRELERKISECDRQGVFLKCCHCGKVKEGVGFAPYGRQPLVCQDCCEELRLC